MQRARALIFTINRFSAATLLSLILILSARTASAAAKGDVGLGVYPTDSHIVAPNGLVYDPLMRLTIALDIGDEDYYFFTENSFYTEKPTPGVTTNSNQKNLDFTKREYDLVLGAAARPFSLKEVEFRLWTVSLANLNRGNDANKPSGFKDGVAAEARYYFKGERLRGFLKAGYFFSKELVEPDGEPYKPGVFAGTEASYGLSEKPMALYAFVNAYFINANCRVEGGLAWRPFDLWSPTTELRASYGQYFNFKEKNYSQSVFLVEAKYYFNTFVSR